MTNFKRFLAAVLIICLLPVAAVSAAETTAPTQPVTRIGVSTLSALPASWGPFAEDSEGKDLILSLTTKPFYNLSEEGTLSSSVAALPVDITAEFKNRSEFGVSENARRGYVFQIDLDPNLFWEDGSKVTADDVLFTLRAHAEQNLLPFHIAGMDAYLQNAQNPSGDVVSLQEAGFSDMTEAKDAGYHHFYLDVTHFWGLDYGWQSIDGRTILHDRAIPTGVNEMYLTPAYLFTNYLADGTSQDHLQSEFIGITTGTVPMTTDDIGMIPEDDHQLILVLEKPTTATALALALSDLVILKEDRFGLGYGSSVASYCSYGPYKVVTVNPREIILEPNEAWRGVYPYDVELIRITPAS